MLLLKVLFWLFVFIVFYSYIGYGIFLYIYLRLTNIFGKKATSFDSTAFEPEVTLIVAAYNEEHILEQKIKNSLELDYPAHKLHFIFVADGSSDNSAAVIARYPQIKLLYKPEREGKVAAINRAMDYVTTPFVIFCDANTDLNRECIREIIRHYKDESIGAVAGEKKIIDQSESGGASGAGEGIYWKYESTLKKLDARFYSVVGAAGELFSIRTALYEPVDKNILLDDFIISMKICKRGYRVMYEPKAYASEAPSFSMKEEQKRKIRISAGGFQSVLILKDLLNIFKYGKLSFQYISHRVLRWIVCPVLLPAILLINIFLWYQGHQSLYLAILIMQIVFYAAAFTGWIFATQNIKIKALYIPYYFVFMNASLYIGFRKFIYNKQSVLWDKAKRQA